MRHSLLLWPQLIGVFGTVMHDDHPEGGVPGPELPQPLAHDSGRTDNNGGLEHAAAVQACQEGSQLYGLPQPHLIPNDAPCPLSVQLPQPLDAWGIASIVASMVVSGIRSMIFTAYVKRAYSAFSAFTSQHKCAAHFMADSITAGPETIDEVLLTWFCTWKGRSISPSFKVQTSLDGVPGQLTKNMMPGTSCDQQDVPV